LAQAEAADVPPSPESEALRLRRQLDVPRLYEPVSLETFELHGSDQDKDRQRCILDLARAYTGDWPDGPGVPRIVVMTGGVGTGKGHILWSISKALVETCLASVRVVVLPDLIRDLRDAWGSHDPDALSESERLKRYREYDLLVIDDVSRHAFYGQPQGHLFDLVAWRHERLKPTILTTNETGSDLAEVLGVPLSSRVVGCRGVWDFGSADWRRFDARRRNDATGNGS
jgi:DNA replication protein DnaC